MEDSGSVSSSFRRWALLSQWPVPLGRPHMLSLLTIIYPTSGFTTLYYPWPHPLIHGEDFPSRKPSNALKTTFVFNYARCGCSLAWKSWRLVCHGAGSRQLWWVEGRGSAWGGAGKQRLWFWSSLGPGRYGNSRLHGWPRNWVCGLWDTLLSCVSLGNLFTLPCLFPHWETRDTIFCWILGL